MPAKHQFATAYIKLILAADPALGANLRHQFTELSDLALAANFVEGELVERLFPALERAGVPSIALQFNKQLYFTSHGPLGFAALSAPDLRTALNTIVQFSAIRSTLFITTLYEDQRVLKIVTRVHSTTPLVQRWLSEVSVLVARSIIEAVMAYDVGSHVRIQFAHAAPPYAEQLDQLFKTQCLYAQQETAISIPVAWGDARCPTSEASSFLDNVQKCRQLLIQNNTELDSAKRVRQYLEHFFASRYALRIERGPYRAHQTSSPPTLATIADSLATSTRTLARRLDAQGNSFKLLLSTTRDQHATQWLQSTHLSIGDIAHLLGYQESANFTRAFKNWHGIAPAQWRKRNANSRSIAFEHAPPITGNLDD